jgi:hypothetical protein
VVVKILATRLCSAGIDHSAVKLDDAAWMRLAPAGVQHIEANAELPAEDIELRTCPCGSTLGRRITPTA